MINRIFAAFLLFVSGLLVVGCNSNSATSVASGVAPNNSPMFISVVSDMDSNPQAVDMAMKLAGFGKDEGRDVFLFFNVKGVRIASEKILQDAAFGSEPSIRSQIEGLLQRGVQMHACPICMKGLAIDAQDLLSGIEVTTKAGLFQKIGPTTCVFTY
ncbi:MAG: DsrE family protein [Pirellulaceae bacterium]